MLHLKKTHSTSSISTNYLNTTKTIKGMAICLFQCLGMVHSHPKYHAIYDERLHKFSRKQQPVAYPSPNDILEFITKIEKVFAFPSEVYIIAAIYMDRLATISHIYLTVYSWKRILLIAVVASAKFILDATIRNSDFVHIFPHVSDIVVLEKEFLRHIQFGLFVERLHFNKYYFAVNSMAT
uniref:Cyclin N-terminal domain-containing protein n=1 Tax=Arcella intermedia TaxID=1963864 RepID=A0A6B2LKV5_9EUKA